MSSPRPPAPRRAARAARQGRSGRPGRRVGLPLALLLGLLSPGAAAALNGAYRDSPHGNRQTGVARVPGLARGECAHCHGAPRDASGRKSEGTGHTRLHALNDDTLCLGCHRKPAGTWLGERAYQQSSHGGSPTAVWPGPDPRARDARDAGKCVNCHDPHGVRDAAGVIPDHLRVRGAALCLGCHGGAAGPDVATDLAKTYRHPLVTPAPASPRGAPAAAPPGGTCAACHNPHAAAPDQAGVPRALLGVARVRISNGAPGTPPVRTWTEPADVTAVREHEVCLGCHGATAATLARPLDVASALNPANASFHPVEATARGGADRRSFQRPWGPGRLVACSDCHGSDDGLLRGPHGSRWPHVLRRRAPSRGPGQQAMETDLCFECHAWRTYGDPFAGAERGYSRFPGHADHVARGESCWACHAAHGSVALPALLALRTPGLVTFRPDPAGGACTSSCHVATPAATTYRSPIPR